MIKTLEIILGYVEKTGSGGCGSYFPDGSVQ